MSFFKRLFGGQQSQKQEEPAQTPAPVMPDEVKQLLFNGYGSDTYDDVVWLSQHFPKTANPVFGGLNYISKAIQQLQPFVPDAAALVQHYTGSNVKGLRQAISTSPDVATRFFVNSVEFQARIEHALGTLTPTSTEYAESIREWLKQEDATHKLATSTASFFTVPLAWSLAQDNEWMQVDASPKTRMLLWGTLATANVFGGHMLSQFKQHFKLDRTETEEAVFAHMRFAWMGYVTQVIDAEGSPPERAVISYLSALTGNPRMLEVYGMHMMNAMRNQMYKVDPQAKNYDHFALILRPYAPQVEKLDEAQAEEFFQRSRLLPFTAGETQWLQKIVQADITEGNATALDQNLNEQVMAMMRHPLRREFQGFQG